MLHADQLNEALDFFTKAIELNPAYIEAYQATEKEEYANTAREILEYVLRDMRSLEGGFYSGEDADSEGEEGKFYLWTQDEIRETLTEKEAR